MALGSTKTRAVMELLAGGQAAVGFPQGPRLDREELPAGRLVRVLGPHVLAQHFADEPGYAYFPLGRLDPHPLGDLFIQGDRDVSHDPRVVEHGVRGNNAPENQIPGIMGS